MNVLDVLHHDHLEVAKLLDKAAEETDHARLAKLFQSIRQDFEAHAHAEEALFYPQLQRIGSKAADAVAKAVAQHGEAIIILIEMAKLKPGEHQFASKLKAFTHAVQTHVKHEETVMFPLMREHFPQEAESMGPEMKRQEKAFKAEGDGKDLR